MRRTLLKILRSLASILLGYIVIVICTIAGFKPLGGIIHLHAPLRIQAAGAFVAILSGLWEELRLPLSLRVIQLGTLPACWYFFSSIRQSCCPAEAQILYGSTYSAMPL
jgi:hypothetical protein